MHSMPSLPQIKAAFPWGVWRSARGGDWHRVFAEEDIDQWHELRYAVLDAAAIHEAISKPCETCKHSPCERYVTCSPPEAADFHDDQGQGYIYEDQDGEMCGPTGKPPGRCVACTDSTGEPTGSAEPQLLKLVREYVCKEVGG